MNAQEREVFWNTLCSLPGEDIDREAQQLQQTIIYPKQLCRYRSVNDRSLESLQMNRIHLSSADRYDDPFDTFLNIDIKAIIRGFLDSILSAEQTEKLLDNIRQLPGHPLHAVVQNGMTVQQLQQLIFRSEIPESFASCALEAREWGQKTSYSICFSENPRNEALWLKYADRHKGFVLVYEPPFCPTPAPSAESGFLASLYPIHYTDKAYDASKFLIYLLGKETEQLLGQPVPGIDEAFGNVFWEFERVSLIKKKCHEYDEEWRLLSAAHSAPEELTWKPNAVILGFRMEVEKASQVIQAAQAAGIERIYKTCINVDSELDMVQLSFMGD